jgi:hypothetical protein
VKRKTKRPAAKAAPARRSYPRQPSAKASAAPRRRRAPKRNPPLFSGDLFRDAGLGLAGFVVAHYAGKVASKLQPSGFLGTPAGQAVISAGTAIFAGQMAGRMFPGARPAVTAGGMVAAGRGLLAKIGVPGLGGLGADEALSAKDVEEVRLLAQELKAGGQAGILAGDDESEYGLTW